MSLAPSHIDGVPVQSRYPLVNREFRGREVKYGIDVTAQSSEAVTLTAERRCVDF